MKTLNILTFIVALIIVAGLGILLYSQQTEPRVAPAEIREQASLLRAHGLDAQAVELYEDYLRRVALPPDEAASLHYLVGTLYEDSLNDPANALAHYLILQERYETHELAQQVGRRLVACQEALGRTRQAQRTLAQLTDLDPASVDSATAGVVVAQIGERQITLGQVEALLENLPAWQRRQIEQADDGLQQFVEQFVVNELLYNRALRQGYDEDEDFKQQVAMLQRQLLAERVRKSVRDDIKITAGDVQRYYEANRKQYNKPATVDVAQVLTKDRAAAQQALQRLQQGEAVGKVARELSTDAKTRDKGGALGTVREGAGFVPGVGPAETIVPALFATEVGSATGPFETKQGWHVFVVQDRTAAEPQAFADVKDRVQAELLREKEQEALQALVQDLLHSEKAAIFKERIPG